MKLTHLIALSALAVTLRADVKTEEKTNVKMGGMMGRFAGMFGGKAAREGVVNTVAVRGDRKMTLSDTNGQIIDLAEEKIYEIDVRDRSYRVVTFEEMRRRMREAREKMSKMPREGGQPPPAAKDGDPQMEIDFSMKESGQKKNINGYDCREVVTTITTRQKGKTLEEAGGMVMTNNLWLGPKIPAMKEVEEFDLKYAKKMADIIGLGDMQQMAAAMAMYPAMKEMMAKFQAENVNLDGTAIQTVMTMDMVPAASAQSGPGAPEQKQQAERESRTNITSVRGLGGLIGRRMAKRKQESEAQPAPGEGAPKREPFMTSLHELVKVSTQLAPSDLAIPAGFKEKR